MKSVFDEYAEEVAAEKVAERDKEIAISLLKDNIYPASKIAELTKLPIEEIEALQKAI